MKNKKIIITLLSAAILLFSGVLINKNYETKRNTKENEPEEVLVPESINAIPPGIIDNVAPDLEQDFRSKAKDFEAHDENGNEVRLSDYEGKYLVLNFWNSNYESCKEELPYFEEAMKKYEGQVTFLMINMVNTYNETKETALQYLIDNNLEINTIFDDHYDARVNYKVTSLPRTVFIDKNGLIQKNIRFSLNKETLEEQIINLINN